MACQPRRELHLLAARIGYAARKAQRALASGQPPVVFAQTDAALSAIGRVLGGYPEDPDTVLVSVPRAVAPRIPPIATGLNLHRTLEMKNGRHDHNMGAALARARAQQQPCPSVVHQWRGMKNDRDHATHRPFREAKPEKKDWWVPYSSPQRFTPRLARDIHAAVCAYEEAGIALPALPAATLSGDLEDALRTAATAVQVARDNGDATLVLRAEAEPFVPSCEMDGIHAGGWDPLTTIREVWHAAYKIPSYFSSIIVQRSAIQFIEVPRIQCVIVKEAASQIPRAVDRMARHRACLSAAILTPIRDSEFDESHGQGSASPVEMASRVPMEPKQEVDVRERMAWHRACLRQAVRTPIRDTQDDYADRTYINNSDGNAGANVRSPPRRFTPHEAYVELFRLRDQHERDGVEGLVLPVRVMVDNFGAKVAALALSERAARHGMKQRVLRGCFDRDELLRTGVEVTVDEVEELLHGELLDHFGTLLHHQVERVIREFGHFRK